LNEEKKELRSGVVVSARLREAELET